MGTISDWAGDGCNPVYADVASEFYCTDLAAAELELMKPKYTHVGCEVLDACKAA